MNLRKAILKAIACSPLIGKQTTSSQLWYGGTGFNWRNEAGDTNANSTVAIGVQAIIDLVGQSMPIAARDMQGKLVIDDRADVQLEPFRNSPYFSGPRFWQVLAMSLKIWGPAYIVVVRDAGGAPAMFLPFMHPQVQAFVRDDQQFWYIRPHGTFDTMVQEVADADVIKLGWGQPDLKDGMRSVSPLMMLLRQICTDNEIATFTAMLLRNGGFPGVILSPKMPDGDDAPKQVRDRIIDQWKSFTRDNRGNPFVSPVPLDVTSPPTNSKNMELSITKKLVMSELLAALGVDPLAVGLPSESKTYANYQEARKALIEDTVLPLWVVMLSPVEQFLRTEGLWAAIRPTTILQVDKSRYPQLQADRYRANDDARDNFMAGATTRGEFREQLGYTTDIGDKRLYFDISNAKDLTNEGLSRGERLRLARLHELTDDRG